jgi:hypothetical protein
VVSPDWTGIATAVKTFGVARLLLLKSDMNVAGANAKRKRIKTRRLGQEGSA